jgi:hypothetical protein
MELIFNKLEDIFLWLEEPCTEHPHYKGYGYNDEISCERHRKDCEECWNNLKISTKNIILRRNNAQEKEGMDTRTKEKTVRISNSKIKRT